MKIKSLLIKCSVATLFALSFSCTEEAIDPAVPDGDGISAVPSVFIQKVLIEEYTQTTCGQCPKAHYYIDSIMSRWPGRVYAMSINVGDTLQPSAVTSPVTGNNLLDSMFNMTSTYPGGLVNRIQTSPFDFAIDNWVTSVESKIGQVPSCGLAIEASNIRANNHLDLIVHTGFSDNMYGDYRLHGFIIENVVSNSDSSFDQLNDFSFEGVSPDTTLPFYSLNDTIHQYGHKFVLRKMIANNGVLGDVIPPALMIAGRSYVKTYDVDMTGINTNNCRIIFFVDKFGNTPDTHWIENVQEVPIGSTKDWN